MATERAAYVELPDDELREEDEENGVGRNRNVPLHTHITPCFSACTNAW